MAEREAPDEAAKGIEDPDAFREACAIFGDAGARTRLRTFRAELETHLHGVGRDPTDIEALREVAHQTAGRAGVLGFPTLAEASSRLEEAIRADTRVTAVLAHWTETARLAVAGGADTNGKSTARGG